MPTVEAMLMIRPPGRSSHCRDRSAADEEDAVQVDPDDAVPLLHREGIDVDAVGDRVHAGIVDEDVEPAEDAQRFLEPRARSRACRGRPSRPRSAFGSVAAKACRLLDVDVGDHHGGAVGGEGRGDRAPDAVRRAGDERHLAAEIAPHRRPPVDADVMRGCPCYRRHIVLPSAKISHCSLIRSHAAASPETAASISTEAARGERPPGGDSQSAARRLSRGRRPALQAAPRDSARIRSSAARPPVGTPLPREADLAESFQVSLITVRQALRDLEAEGLIQKRAAKPAIVADPSARG